MRRKPVEVEAEGEATELPALDLPIPENQPLGENGRSLLIKIGAACRSLAGPSSHLSILVHSVLQALFFGGQETFSPLTQSTALHSLRQACLASESLEACAGLIHVLALMRYRIGVERYFNIFFYA